MSNQQKIQAEVIRLREEVHDLQQLNQELLHANNELQKRHWKCNGQLATYSKDELEKIIMGDLLRYLLKESNMRIGGCH
jgi:peptidoglycan hydrolase CwlO-like protein